jgi:formamidopyrimidine-DNA glycosylase
MPELPEVETIVRGLAPQLEGARILAVEVNSQLILRHHQGDLSEALCGQAIRAVSRHGKHILMRLDRGVLIIHLGMTGKLLVDAERNRHTHAIFTLDRGALLYDDTRQFGSIEWHLELPQRMERLGPEPFDITPNDFFKGLARRHTSIKALIMNQTLIRGMGNIYTDEALWRARIHPKTNASRLSKPRALRCLTSIVEVLLESIEHRGSSISDYVDAGGRSGAFQFKHNVYGREGKPCPRCGTPIRKIVLAQRGTHYCPKCQRA